MNSLISLAIPVRNGENFLEQCLESVAAANRGRYEVVVSNNCSTDRTQEILEHFQQSMPELRIVQATQDFNLSENLNFLVSQCSGLWVKFLCHDDLFLPEALDHIESALVLAHENTALIGNEMIHLFPSGYESTPKISSADTFEASTRNGQEYLLQVLAGKANVPNLSSACVKREIFLSRGGFDPRWIHCDLFLWSSMLINHDYISLQNAIAVNRIHSGQLTALARNANRNMKEHREFWPEFIAEYSKQQPLPIHLVIKLHLKWVFVAACDAGIFWRNGNKMRAVKVLASTGILLLPVAIGAFVRSLYKEKKRLAKVEQHIPVNEIYSGS